MRTTYRDRVSGALAAAVALGALGTALVLGLAVDRATIVDVATMVSTISLAPPARRDIPPPVVHRLTRAADRPSPPNLRAKATDLVVPAPLVIPPISPIPIVTARLAATGTATANGASDRAGPGMGAGGNGNGSGGGGEGDGDETPPLFLKGELSYADLTRALRLRHAQGTVGIRYSIEVNGRVGTCEVTRSSGDPELDTATCRAVQHRFRYRPSHDADHKPVRSFVVDDQSWIVDMGEAATPRP